VRDGNTCTVSPASLHLRRVGSLRDLTGPGKRVVQAEYGRI